MSSFNDQIINLLCHVAISAHMMCPLYVSMSLTLMLHHLLLLKFSNSNFVWDSNWYLHKSFLDILLILFVQVKNLVFCRPEDETPIKNVLIRKIPRYVNYYIYINIYVCHFCISDKPLEFQLLTSWFFLYQIITVGNL